MILDDAKQKYKNLPLWARFLLMFIIGLGPGFFYYFDEGQSYEDQLAAITSQEATARSEFEKARQKKADLPKLEEKLAFTEDQLNKAKKLLPDRYIIEDILEKTATIALKTKVLLERFRPLNEVAHDTEGYRYVELPIETQITGEYQNIATFFDRISHLETTIFLRNITIIPSTKNAAQAAGSLANSDSLANPSGTPASPPSPGLLNQNLNQQVPGGNRGSPQANFANPTNLTDLTGLTEQAPTGPKTSVMTASAASIASFTETATFNLVIYRSLAEHETAPPNPINPNSMRQPVPPATQPPPTPTTTPPPAT